MRTHSAWLHISILALAGALYATGAARADSTAPQLWTNPDNRAQRVYADGQHAIGGVRQATMLGQAEVTLLGVRRDTAHSYTGPVGGVLHGGRGDQTISGRWSMDPASKLVSINATCAGMKFAPQIRVPEPSDPAPLRC